MVTTLRTAVPILLVAALLAGCSVDPSERPDAHGDESAPLAGTRDQRVLAVGFGFRNRNRGDRVAPRGVKVGKGLQLTEVRSGSGAITVGRGPHGGKAAVIRAGARPRDVAVLRVSGPGRVSLSPKSSPFRFGLNFKPARVPAGGANLMQRGLFDSGGQYKLQVDGGRPSCRIRGALGAMLVKADVKIVRGAWFRLVCERREDLVTLRLGTFVRNGIRWQKWQASGLTGSIDVGEPAFPLAVGGKLNARGGPVTPAEDQFVGTVDSVFLEILR